MVNFANPGVLGDATTFRRYYEIPILRGREPTASDEQRMLGTDRSAKLSEKVNQFILRRTNALLSNHLPPKIVEAVCCRLTDLQANLYRHFIESKNVKQVLQGSEASRSTNPRDPSRQRQSNLMKRKIRAPMMKTKKKGCRKTKQKATMW